MKKTISIILFSVFSLFCVSPIFSADTEVTIYSWRLQEKELWEAVNKTKSIPGVKINFRNLKPDDYDTKLKVDMQSYVPDVFQERAGAARISEWKKAGVVKPVNESWLSSMSASSLEAVALNGKYYGVPFAVQLQSVIYNKAVFKKAGIREPKNLNELAKAMDKLKSNGKVPMHFAGRAGWWVNQVLAEVMTAGMVSDKKAADLVAGKACFTDPEYVKALGQVADWAKKGYLNSNVLADDYGAMRSAVALGDSAMMIDGAWSSGPASPMYEIDPDLELGFFPVPGPNGKVYSFGDGGYFVNQKSKNKAAAEKVLKFTTTKQFAELFAKHVGEIPAYSKAFNISDPRLKTIAGLISSKSLQSTPFFAYALNEKKPTYQSLLTEAYQAVLSQKTSPAEAAQIIQKGLNSWNYIGAKKCAK